ncbi:MAG: twitch domain-containing radical SAM protein [Proteobacteria bacterium]|nr:twitch domain-containing radical SAM protein [Pseudomonadota bacterium]NBP13102.1 twitch domain-containing radical SAM protein [bacterium]
MTQEEFMEQREKMGQLCNAPFNSLYIGQRGHFFVCCANRFYKLGTYPKQSIMEIWNGAPLQKIRNEMKKMKFNAGCGHCSHNLQCGNFGTLKIPFYDYEGTEDNLKYPLRLDLELDNICNLECIMCNGNHSSSIRKNREKLPKYVTPYDDNFYKELFEILPHVKRVDFYGGEPFLIPGYFKILDFVNKNKLKINFYLQTNGTIFNAKIERYLKEIDIDIGISIDAGTKDLYEKIRKNAKFDKVIENINNINNILKLKNKTMTISSVVMGNNILDLHNIVNIANHFNARIYFHKLMFPRRLSLEGIDENNINNVYNIMASKKFFINNPTAIQLDNISKYKDLTKEIRHYKEKLSKTNITANYL